MKFTRKEFIKTSALIGAGFAFQGGKLMKAVSENDKRFKSIRNNIGVFTEKGGSIGYYINDDALIVIDTQYPDTAKNLMDGIRKKTLRNIDMLFNTHHHGDHTSGNPYLKQFTKDIIAHENCPKIQRKRNTKPGEEDKLVYANVTFTDNFTTDIGKEKINAFHIMNAHTGGDAVIHFENANVAHLGDLVFNRVFPWFNLQDEGSFRNWIKYLDNILNKFDEETIFIFGHGRGMDLENVTGNKSDVKFMRDYLIALVDFTEKEIKAGKSEDEVATAETITGVSDRTGLWDDAMGLNLREAYKELNKK